MGSVLSNVARMMFCLNWAESKKLFGIKRMVERMFRWNWKEIETLMCLELERRWDGDRDEVLLGSGRG